MSVKDVADGIGRAIELIKEAIGKTLAAREKYGTVEAGMREVLTDSSRQDELTHPYEQIGATLERAAADASGIVEDLEDYVADILGVSPDGGPSTGSSSSPRPAPGPATAPDGPRRDPPVPPTVTRLARGMRPWRKGEKAKGAAYFDEDGVPEEFVSSYDRSGRAGLLPGYAARWVVTDHVEGHVAARMRLPEAPRDTTLVLNKNPCPGPMGCDATLPDIIPAGSTVTIYVMREDGPQWYGTYRGTGKGIA